MPSLASYVVGVGVEGGETKALEGAEDALIVSGMLKGYAADSA